METVENVVALLFILHFLWSYYVNCYRRGYTMDVWHLSLLSLVFTIHVMLPFNRSNLNVFALGPILLPFMQGKLNEAYAVSSLGYLSILIGGRLWRVRLGAGMRKRFYRLVTLPGRGSLILMSSRRLLRLHGMVAACAMFAIILLYFKIMGFGFDVRSILVANPSIRPFGQFSLFYGTLIASYSLLRAVRFRELDMILLTVLLLGELAFFGSRAGLLGVAILTITVGAIRMRRRLRLSAMLAGVAATVAVAILLDALRRPDFSFERLFGTFALQIFYGNSFSDTRDFAVVLHFWDGGLLWGKTYLAGLFAFVPQFLLPFRSKWAIGVVTAQLAGFSPTEHPGLRIGLAGEAYLNFGLAGVVVVGLMMGMVLHLVDGETKRAVERLPISNLRAYSFYMNLILIGVIENSSTASGFYTTMLILWGSWMFLRMFPTPVRGPAAGVSGPQTRAL